MDQDKSREIVRYDGVERSLEMGPGHAVGLPEHGNEGAVVVFVDEFSQIFGDAGEEETRAHWTKVVNQVRSTGLSEVARGELARFPWPPQVATLEEWVRGEE